MLFTEKPSTTSKRLRRQSRDYFVCKIAKCNNLDIALDTLVELPDGADLCGALFYSDQDLIEIADFSSQDCRIWLHIKYEQARVLPGQCVYGTLL